MKNPEKCEKVARAFALLEDATHNLAEAQAVMEKMGNNFYAKTLGTIHNRVETEMLIFKNWFENEMYELTRTP